MPLFYDWAKIRSSNSRDCSTKKKFKEPDQEISGRKTRKKEHNLVPDLWQGELRGFRHFAYDRQSADANCVISIEN